MASRYETTKMCPALSFEGHSYRFDKLVAANAKNDGGVAPETAMGVSIAKTMRKIAMFKREHPTVSIAFRIRKLDALK